VPGHVPFHPAPPGGLHRPGFEPDHFSTAACSELFAEHDRIISSPQRYSAARSIAGLILEHVSPNTAPTALIYGKRAGTSTVALIATTGRHRRQAPAHLIIPTMASKRRCRMTTCSRSTRRTMSSGSTNSAKVGEVLDNSLIRASNHLSRPFRP
jgi:hypothetical protein